MSSTRKMMPSTSIHLLDSSSGPKAKVQRGDSFETTAMEDYYSVVDPYHFSPCVAISTVAMSILSPEVIHEGGPWVMVGFIMRGIALLLAYVLLLHLASIQLAQSRSHFICRMLLRINPRLMLCIITLFAILGGCIQYTAKALTPCNDNRDENEDPCCCNELTGGIFLPPGFYVNIAFLLFLQTVVYVREYWVIIPCWIGIIVSSLVPRIINNLQAWDDDVLCLILFFGISFIFVRQSNFALKRALQLVKSENEAIALQNDAKMLETRMNDMRLLIGNISHDLKTPMQAFSFELHLLEESLDNLKSRFSLLSPKGSDTCDKRNIETCANSVVTLQDTCQFMNSTINRCLDYCKSAVGLALNPFFEAVLVDDVMSWVVNCVNRTHQGEVRVVLEAMPSNLKKAIATDRKWLEENLMCLASNAVRFQMEGIVSVRCRKVEVEPTTINYLESCRETVVSAAGGNDLSLRSQMPQKVSTFIRFEVEDRGVGVSDDMKKALFHPYSKFHSEKMTGGTGLGLYSLSKRVEALGGTCGWEARAQGCLFWFTIPDIETDCDDSVVRVQPMSVKKSRSVVNRNTDSKVFVDVEEDPFEARSCSEVLKAHKTRFILVVDDSVVVQKTAKRVLERLGYEVEIATNGLLAFNILQKRRYDMVLMDIEMPIMDGLEATSKLRKYEEDNAISTVLRQAIVGISANTDDSTRIKALNSGMDDFVSKPFSTEKLKRVLDEFDV